MLILNGWMCSEDSWFLIRLFRAGNEGVIAEDVKNDCLRLLSASLPRRRLPHWLEHPENNEVPRVCSRYRKILRKAHGLREYESNHRYGKVFWPWKNGT